MGWNIGYTFYEKTIVSVYDSGALNAELCRKLIEPYQNTDIDHGGCIGLRSKDGLSADQIVVMLLDRKFWDGYKKTESELMQKFGKWEDIEDNNSPGYKEYSELHDSFYYKWTELMEI